MNDSIKRISLDLHATGSRETVKVKRSDTGRKIYVSLVDGGVPYHISEDCSAVFTGKKPDGNIVYNDCVIEGNVIIYKLTEQTATVPGLVNCEIKLYGADEQLITSPKFSIIVDDTVYEEGDEVETPSATTRALLSPESAKVGQYLQIVEVSEDGKVIKLKAVDAPESSSSSVRVADVTLLAASWVGEASPYSQVVEIEGITEYSQVDLKPSVEQLAIFHDKDLAFVTENEDGVVTVYAVGDKPANDYTMQVSITEVIA